VLAKGSPAILVDQDRQAGLAAVEWLSPWGTLGAGCSVGSLRVVPEMNSGSG